MSAEPMRCREVSRYLSPYADGELAEPLRERVAEHLSGCLSCRRELARLQSASRLVAALPRSAPSPEVLDRVFTATGRSAGEPVVRESLRKRRKPALPARSMQLLPRLACAVRIPRVPRSAHAPHSSHSRLPIPARAAHTRPAGLLPLLAASLVIALATFAFLRHPFAQPLVGQSSSSPAPSVADVLRQTRTEVLAHSAQLAFTPVTPSFLPPGARFFSTAVGPGKTVTAGQQYLDVVWSLNAPLTTLHVRQSPLALAARTDYAVGAPNAVLAWQAGAYPWRAGQYLPQPNHMAVGQDRKTFSISLDIGIQPVAGGARAEQARQAAVAVLRLVSLSLDAPYQFVQVTAPETSASVLHYIAHSASTAGPAMWDAYVDAAHSRERLSVTGAHGQPLYTDFITGDTALRLSPADKTYQRMTTEAAGGLAALPTDVVTFFDGANSLLADGELWNLGLQKLGARQVYALALVGAPHPTTVYVDAKTQRIVAAQVNEAASAQPGGPSASSRLSPASGCPSYTLIEYLDPARAPANIFDTAAVLASYHPGGPIAAVSCAASGN